MIKLTINNFLIYFCLAWGTNISLNLFYVIKKYIPEFKSLNYPIDFNLKYRGDRLIGDSIDFVGLFFCLVLSVVLSFFINVTWAMIPLIVQAGGMLGSFIKRRFHKKSGEFMPFVDHGDYMLLLGVIFVSLGYISLWFALLAILITYILHPIACIIAFKLKLRERPY